MKVLIKAAKVIDNESPFDGKVVDILIEKGIIKKIAAGIDTVETDQEISFENLHVSQGWFDSSVSFGEPGYEERETIDNGLYTAAKSGFTGIALNPANNPVTDNKGTVSYLKSKAKESLVSLYPIGALTKNSKGRDLAELYDMQQAGAVAFGDYKKAISNPNMLKIALQYAQNFDGLVQSFPQDNNISGNGQVNEHEKSTYLGLKGIPALAEELQVARDLFILEYTGGKLHIPTISTAKSVDLIREAKEKGLDVTCSVGIHNLFFTDELLEDFNTNAKVLPPLRSKPDIKALIAAVKDETIDMVTGDHSPIDIENKKVEFDNALFGTVGLESAFGALLKLFSLRTSIRLLNSGKGRFGLPEELLQVGSEANFTFFNPDISFKMNLSHLYSSSKNSIFLDQELKGKVYGIYADGQFFS